MITIRTSFCNTNKNIDKKLLFTHMYSSNFVIFTSVNDWAKEL